MRNGMENDTGYVPPRNLARGSAETDWVTPWPAGRRLLLPGALLV